MSMSDISTPSPPGPSSYLCPKMTDSDSQKLGWLREAIETGQDYLKGNKGYTDIDEAVDLISGMEQEAMSKHVSHATLNFAKRDIEEIVSTLSNIRMLAEFKTDNKMFDTQNKVLNTMHHAWYLATFSDRVIRKALQYSAAGCVGYVSPSWKKDFWSAGRGDIKLTALGPRAVVPCMIGEDHDLQKAYAVSIKREISLAEAIARWPLYQDVLIKNKQQASWLRKGIARVQKFLSPVLNAGYMDKHPEEGEVEYPTVTIWTTYILDLSVNETGGEVEMGDPGTKWNYKVPYVGQDIQTAYRDQNGNILSRKATWEDCLLYPLRRVITSLDTAQIVYDGPSNWWHGKVPAVPFRLNDWPWTYLGFSLIRDVKSPQQELTTLLRALVDSANARLDPPLGYDDKMLSRAVVERLNPRRGGQRIRAALSMGDPIKPLLPAEYYNIPPYILELMKMLSESIPSLLGSRDIAAIAKAKQVPAGDTLEKLMEMAGPRTTDKSRNMESSIQELGEMWKGLAFEFYDLPRRVQMLGADGRAEHDFDYDPGNMIPSHLPDEYALIGEGKMKGSDPSRAGLVERARAHMQSFYTYVRPHSVHHITEMTQRLQYMQLFLRGFPIDPWTVAETMDIPDFGRPPEGTDGSVIGRWIAWKKLLGEVSPQPEAKGRKPSGQVPPSTMSKDGGSRGIVRESPR